MFKIAVCDDEPVFAKQLKEKITEYMPDGEVYEFHRGEDLLAEGSAFDIYLLDIQMEQMNGIETAKKLRETMEDCILIFITGAREYVFDAFDVAAMQYLVKPVEDKKLQEVLKRAEKEIRKKREKSRKKIFVKVRNRKIILDVSDILYFENEMRKIIAHTVKEEIAFYGIMEDMEKQAGDSFCRCHRGYLVNLAYVAEYDSDTITLTNGEKLYLAKERHHNFVKQYLRFLRNGGVLHE